MKGWWLLGTFVFFRMMPGSQRTRVWGGTRGVLPDSHISHSSYLSHVRLFETPWTAARQASLSIINSWSLIKFMSIKSVMPFNCLLLVLLPSIFPSIRVFSKESVLHMRWSKYWSISFGILPMNIQDWFLLGLTGLTSLQSKGLSRVFSNSTVQKHQFFSTQLSLIVQLSHPYMTTGKTIALTRWTFVSKVTSSNSNVFCNPAKFVMFLNVWAFLVFSKVF